VICIFQLLVSCLHVIELNLIMSVEHGISSNQSNMNSLDTPFLPNVSMCNAYLVIIFHNLIFSLNYFVDTSFVLFFME
jgi:hypothetical protein